MQLGRVDGEVAIFPIGGEISGWMRLGGGAVAQAGVQKGLAIQGTVWRVAAVPDQREGAQPGESALPRVEMLGRALQTWRTVFKHSNDPLPWALRPWDRTIVCSEGKAPAIDPVAATGPPTLKWSVNTTRTTTPLRDRSPA